MSKHKVEPKVFERREGAVSDGGYNYVCTPEQAAAQRSALMHLIRSLG